MTWFVMQADARRIPLKNESAHCVVTSPPYWRLRDYKLKPQIWAGRENCEHSWSGEKQQYQRGKVGSHSTLQGGSQRPESKNGSQSIPLGQFCAHCFAWLGVLGLEPTPDLYVEHIVETFREIRRVLRKDGTCWVNLGDSYSSGDRQTHGTRVGHKQQTVRAMNGITGPLLLPNPPGLKPKDLCMIPARVVLALQADGWWLRSEIIWSKSNPMPESVNGWRWENHKVKIQKGLGPSPNRIGSVQARDKRSYLESTEGAQWADCLGCPKCDENDGLILRKASWRPTTAHEYIFLLTKSADYYCDADAVREAVSGTAHARQAKDDSPPSVAFKMQEFGNRNRNNPSFQSYMHDLRPEADRNLRSVWQIATQPFHDGHFATFPEEIPLRCIKAGTSEKGCCAKCGAPWARIIEKPPVIMPEKTLAAWQRGPGSPDQVPAGRYYGGKWLANGDEGAASYRLNNSKRYWREQGGDHNNPFIPGRTIDWKPSCKCGTEEHRPAVVLDPFSGSGTVPLVADKLGRMGIGLDLKWDYCEMARNRCVTDTPLLAAADEGKSGWETPIIILNSPPVAEREEIFAAFQVPLLP